MTNKEIQRRVYQSKRSSAVLEALKERQHKAGLGMVVDVESIDRTIDDLAGFYEGGKFYGATAIAAAFGRTG